MIKRRPLIPKKTMTRTRARMAKAKRRQGNRTSSRRVAKTLNRALTRKRRARTTRRTRRASQPLMSRWLKKTLRPSSTRWLCLPASRICRWTSCRPVVRWLTGESAWGSIIWIMTSQIRCGSRARAISLWIRHRRQRLFRCGRRSDSARRMLYRPMNLSVS